MVNDRSVDERLLYDTFNRRLSRLRVLTLACVSSYHAQRGSEVRSWHELCTVAVFRSSSDFWSTWSGTHTWISSTTTNTHLRGWTHTHARTDTRGHAHMHVRTDTQRYTNARRHTSTFMYTFAHTHTYTYTHTHTHTQTHAGMHAQARAQTRTQAHTHTHIHNARAHTLAVCHLAVFFLVQVLLLRMKNFCLMAPSWTVWTAQAFWALAVKRPDVKWWVGRGLGHRRSEGPKVIKGRGHPRCPFFLALKKKKKRARRKIQQLQPKAINVIGRERQTDRQRQWHPHTHGLWDRQIDRQRQWHPHTHGLWDRPIDKKRQ